MFPASSKGGGQCAAFPDVCKTPAPPAPFVPIPYPNMAQVPQANGTISTVLFSNKDAVVESSKIPMSSGDEAGTLGGMISSVFKNQVAYKIGSSKVYAKGKKVEYVGAMTAHNGSNANMPAGAQVAPSQVNVIVSA